VLKSVQLAGIPVGKGHPVRLMGVINISPESFYKESVFNFKNIAKSARDLEKAGADFIDVGAMSTAPYLKTQISEKEEARRMEKAVRIIKKATRIPISIDTSRAFPAKAGLRAGAKIINDIHGLTADPLMPRLAKKAEGLILMAHPSKEGEGKLKSPIDDVRKILSNSLRLARTYQIPASKIVLDPGIGFFRKTKLPWWKWDLTVIQQLSKLASLNHPLLVGLSRKSFIGHLMNGAAPEERLPGSLIATLISVQNGASLIRTHDVAATKMALRVAETLLR